MASKTETLRLAAEAGCDPKSAAKAIDKGADAVRGQAGERIAQAAKRLGIKLGRARS